MAEARWFIRVGITGAIVPAVLFFCLGSLGGGLLPGLLISLLLLTALSATWGATAGLLTFHIWRRRSRTMASLMGVIGTCSGLLALYILLIALRPWSHPSQVDSGSMILLGTTVVVAGILIQTLAVFILVGLRNLIEAKT